MHHPELTPLSWSNVDKIETHFRMHGHVKCSPQEKPQCVNEDTNLGVLLRHEENPVTAARQISTEYDLCHETRKIPLAM